MQKDGKDVKKTPEGQEYGPTEAFAAARGASESCGQSGSRYCSFVMDKTQKAKDQEKRQHAFQDKSKKDLPGTLDNCGC